MFSIPSSLVISFLLIRLLRNARAVPGRALQEQMSSGNFFLFWHDVSRQGVKEKVEYFHYLITSAYLQPFITPKCLSILTVTDVAPLFESYIFISFHSSLILLKKRSKFWAAFIHSDLTECFCDVSHFLSVPSLLWGFV